MVLRVRGRRELYFKRQGQHKDIQSDTEVPQGYSAPNWGALQTGKHLAWERGRKLEVAENLRTSIDSKFSVLKSYSQTLPKQAGRLSWDLWPSPGNPQLTQAGGQAAHGY